jgi:hypothetical protein
MNSQSLRNLYDPGLHLHVSVADTDRLKACIARRPNGGVNGILQRR